MQSEEWGPYRIEERLGTGGMGEVYRAYDRRLDRWVALKIIRPEVSGGKKARERFRREARSAARLSHPTVLQIHDIIERDEGDGIVMELVEGETLGRILKRGPMELDRVVRLAREVAEGLAAAHGQGIIHRDLKAENVMITPEDHAKILDFGLAKRLGPSADQSISIDGRVVGTSHAMSPEQAQGFRVDHRSDLFSLGILLYEMVGGASPFRRPALAETLTRVCVHEQTPVKELRPEVPAELSDLIDELLRKKPEDRPQEAREVALALRQLEPTVSVTMDPVSYPTMVDLPRATATGSTATVPSLGGGGEPRRSLPVGEGTESWWYRSVTLARRPVAWGSALAVIAVAAVAVVLFRPNPPTITVAVLQPDVHASKSAQSSDLLASGVRVALMQGALNLEGLTVVAPDEVDAVQGTSKDITRATAADEVLATRLDCVGISCQVSVTRVGRDGDVLAADRLRVLSDELLSLAEAVQEGLGRVYPDYRPRVEEGRFEVSTEDYEAFLRTREAFLSREEGVTIEQLLDRCKKIERSSPRFMLVYILEAALARSRFIETRDPSDLDRALEATERARRLAPRSPQPLVALVDTALDGGQLDIAEKGLEELERLAPGEPVVLAQKAVLLERRQKPAQALQMMRSAVQRLPSVKNLFDLANMEVRQGLIPDAREHLVEILDRHPGHFRAKRVLAQIELLNGEPQEAAALYKDLAEMTPEPRVLTNLGIAQILLGNFKEAEESFRQASDLVPGSPLVDFNLADALVLQGREAEAFRIYEEVLQDLKSDPAAKKDWGILAVQAQALAHLGYPRQAVAAVQEALRLAPESPQAALEAAIVYALIGEDSSCLAHIERALSLGIQPVWFRLPWFEDVRKSPDFQLLLDSTASSSEPTTED